MIHLLCHHAKKNNSMLIKKSDYVATLETAKLETMIHGVIIKSTYIEQVTDNMLKELSRFRTSYIETSIIVNVKNI